jgi:general secretion pathway protein F
MNFEVKMLEPGGRVSRIEVEAVDDAQARQQLQREGHAVLAVRPVRRLRWPDWGFSRRFSLTVFSQELLALIDAGMSQVEALETLVDENSSNETRRMLKDILTVLYEGKTLSQALQRHPQAFPPLYIELVRASERTGSIADTIRQYIGYQTRIEQLRKKVVNASIYPAILISAGVLVCGFLMLYVVPKFSLIYVEMGRDLPFLSGLLMQWGAWLSENSVLFFSVLSVALALLARQWQRHGLLASLLKLVVRIPMVGEQVRVHQLALFYRTISILLRAGINIVPAMNMVEGILRSDMQPQERQARQAISEGRSVSLSMLDAGLTTPVGYKLLRVGEKSGQLDELTERIADFYDEDISRWLDWFTKLFEPLLMAVIGLVIGAIVVVMYFPIFDIASNVQ